jgi:hypothetical protein
MVEDLIKRLKEAAQAATPQNIDNSERIEIGIDGQKYIECSHCGGEGAVELEADYCNYDDAAIGVQFYGIGNEFGAAEAYFRAASPATILEIIDLIEQQSARIAALESERDALLAAAGKEAVAWIAKNTTIGPGEIETTIDWYDSDIEALPVGTKLYAATAPTAAPENGDGRDAEKMIADLEAEQTYIASSRETCSRYDVPRWDRIQAVIDYLKTRGA